VLAEFVHQSRGCAGDAGLFVLLHCPACIRAIISWVERDV
jgi:hypothetical protein